MFGEGAPEKVKKEKEPGQEGSLLLTTQGIINCDAHYEYHSMVFNYDSALGTPGPGEDPYENRRKFSWYVKSPFNPEGKEPVLNADGWYELPEECDCRWVKFTLNEVDGSDNYETIRQQYPGISKEHPNYYPDWFPGNTDATKGPVLSGLPAPTMEQVRASVPKLMDINQLVNFLFWQNELKYAGKSNLFDNSSQIRVTAFVDEFYYETDPFTGELDPNLWRTFVNALPRELHILSDAERSKDRKSDVITSSHSIIQQSIQTIYNIYSPTLTSLWGTEHNDIIHKGSEYSENSGWPWWPVGSTSLPSGSVNYGDEDNGRYNTAGLWGITDGNSPEWNTYLNFAVNNNVPELKEDYHYLAYACMTRNRDNNGNGIIDEDELRWYTASINQLVGMWVGNESLTQTSRLYQPRNSASSSPVDWRSETVSSTITSATDPSNPLVIRSEEGGTKSTYNNWTFWKDTNGHFTDADHYKVTSVRCLRNIGTFRENGVQKDISYAPAERVTDQYYECDAGFDSNGKAWPNPDGTYTIQFSHLNPMSIREYSPGELPYHDEYSLHNCVYLRFTAQSKDNFVVADDFAAELDKFNFAITTNNNYCPPGYRVPNMTELVLMSALLPADYWTKLAGGTVINYPSRTYYSRGKLGTKTTGEAQKVGWGYSYCSNATKIRMHLLDASLPNTGIRCVTDDKMVGDITGGLIVDNAKRQERGEIMVIDLNFSSMGSAIEEIALELRYTGPNGNQRKIDIPYMLEEPSPTVKDSVHFRIPDTFPVLGSASVHATVRNSYGTVREFSTPIQIRSDLKLSIKLLPCQYDAEENDNDKTYKFPILITAYNVDLHSISDLKLNVTSPIGTDSYLLDLPDYGGTGVTYASKIVYYDPNEDSELLLGSYSFQIQARSDETITRSTTVSMD